MDDPRLSDEATGLPPLEEIGEDEAILVLSWMGGEGLVLSPATGAIEPCRFLHVRGLAVMDTDPTRLQWVQAHIAIPTASAMEAAVALMGGAPDVPT